MKITLYLSKKVREQQLRDALTKGFTKHSETVVNASTEYFDNQKTDLAVFVGVKSRRLFESCAKAGVPTLLIDKAYFARTQGYYRVSLGGYQPPYLDDFEAPDATRLNALGVQLQPRRIGGRKVVFAGSSQKYCQFHGLGDVNEYARRVCADLNNRLKGEKQVVYRPKPSWWANHNTGYTPPKTEFSGPHDSFRELLVNAHCLVTHGSNAAIEALCAGIPVIALSNKSVTPVYDLCEHRIFNVHKPAWPTDTERIRIMSKLAWCQFNMSEIANGFMWSVLIPWYGYQPKP